MSPQIPPALTLNGDSEAVSETKWVVHKDGVSKEVEILDRRDGEAYVHYVHTDKRMDEWVLDSALRPSSVSTPSATEASLAGHKRKRSWQANGEPSSSLHTTYAGPSPNRGKPIDHFLTTKEQDPEAVLEHHKFTAKRNYDNVVFGTWEMKTWYYSPYPMLDEDAPPAATFGLTAATSHSQAPSPAPHPEQIPPPKEKAPVKDQGKLWVCDKCFKYMRQGLSWELHMKRCTMDFPPGRKVYQRGAHTIWEVDGAKDMLYCQNLALFGKLFIDIKTIFYDCENFMFYLLTDGDSRRDHVLGFFSKEKVSYDEWNLACIITFPPYQKKGYGMLLIEFSYELSKRAGKLGTPERPLSDLGLRSYLAFWTAVLVRLFRRVLGTEIPELPSSPTHARRVSLSKRKKTKGFDGEVEEEGPSAAVISEPAGFTFGSIRTTHTERKPDGIIANHLNVRCTLMDIAKATGLRHEDVAFTLEDCGLLQRRKKSGKEEEETIIISSEMVERVARERGVKQRCILDQAHVLL